MSSWPSILPRPLAAGYGINPADQSLRTDMEAGAARVRRRSRARLDMIDIAWKFTDAQMAVFREWFGNSNTVEASGTAQAGGASTITLAAGVPLLDALDSVAGATGNSVLKEAVLRLKQHVATGTQIHVAMSSSGAFPDMAIQMTAIGEESGTLDSMLNHVATYYESEVDTLVDNLTTLMEPAIMVVLGIVVGGLVIAMYLPIFKLGQVI